MTNAKAPFVHRIPVRFSDVDHAGIVYYPIFFHYFHVAFEEFFLQRMGARSYVELLDVDRVGFPSVASDCTYKSPLRFGDEVDVEMSIEKMGGKSVRFRYRMYRVDTDADAERTLCAEGTNTTAVVDLDRFVAVALPDRVDALFRQIAV